MNYLCKGRNSCLCHEINVFFPLLQMTHSPLYFFQHYVVSLYYSHSSEFQEHVTVDVHLMQQPSLLD